MSDVDALVPAFRACWIALREQRSLSKPLEKSSSEANKQPHSLMRDLLKMANARAVGWWVRQEEDLVLVSFQAVADMPEDVRLGFAAAMARVGLSRVELGCVRAAAECRPVIAREDAAQRGLGGSASWLERFGTSQSLAIPILEDGQAAGVLAIATENVFDEGSFSWQLLDGITSALSQPS